jgi:hypothetical protein
MMTEGVRSGSQGPKYYPAATLQKHPSVWNHKPVVVLHPKKDGVDVSAADPDILNTRCVGVVLNSVYNGKLTADAWLEVDRLNAIDPRIMNALEAGKPVEISTGILVEEDFTAGEFDGKPYSSVVKNMIPDHLAILPDALGACSVKDGCGMLANCSCSKCGAGKTTSEKEDSSMEKKALVDHLIANAGWEESDRETLDKLSEDKLKKLVEKTAVTNAAKKAAEDKVAADAKAKADAKAAAEAVTNAKKDEPVELTTEQYIAKMPTAVQQLINNALALQDAERTRLSGIVLANKSNVFTAEQLAEMDINVLSGIARVADVAPAVPVANRAPLYLGAQGGVPVAPVGNAAMPAPLPLTKMDWGTPASKN